MPVSLQDEIIQKLNDNKEFKTNFWTRDFKQKVVDPLTAISGINIQITSFDSLMKMGWGNTLTPFTVELNGEVKQIPIGSQFRFVATEDPHYYHIIFYEDIVFPNQGGGRRRVKRTRKHKHRKSKSKRRGTYRR